MNYAALEQERRSIKAIIDENPVAVIVWRRPMVADGFGGLVEDPFGELAPTSLRGRVSKTTRGPEDYTPAPVGVDLVDPLYFLVDWQTSIYVNDTFEAMDRRWRLGPVTRIQQHGGVVAYEAPMIQAETKEELNT